MRIHARHITSLISTAILLGVAAQKDNRDALSYLITAYLPRNQVITFSSGYEPAKDIYGLFSDFDKSLCKINNNVASMNENDLINGGTK